MKNTWSKDKKRSSQIRVYQIFTPKNVKQEKILEDCLDLIPSPSPSVKIQMIGGKVYLRCKGKTLLGDVNKLFFSKVFVSTMFCLYTSSKLFHQ